MINQDEAQDSSGDTVGMKTTPHVLLVTKPMAPPWIDSARNLPRNLIEYARHTSFHIMTDTQHEDLAYLPCNPFPCTDSDCKQYRNENACSARHEIDLHPFSSASGSRNGTFRRIVTTPVYHSTPGLHVSFADRLRVTRFLIAQWTAARFNSTTGIFHFFSTPTVATSRLIRQLRRIHNATRLIHTVTSCPAGDLPAAFQHLASSDPVIALSRNTRDILQNALNRPVHHIRPGIPLPPIPNDADIAAARATLKLPHDKQFVLYAGDLQFSNVMPIFRRMLPEWRSHLPNCRLILAVRSKDPADAAHLNELAALAGDTILILDNFCDMIRLVCSCDAVIFPVMSLYGKMDIPLVLLESMALQKPVITSKLSSLAELSETEGTLTADPTRPDTFFAALDHVLSSRESAIRLGRTARESVVSRFSAANMAEAVESVYQSLLPGVFSR